MRPETRPKGLEGGRSYQRAFTGDWRGIYGLLTMSLKSQEKPVDIRDPNDNIPGIDEAVSLAPLVI